MKRFVLLLIILCASSAFAQSPVYGFPDNFSTIYYDYSQLTPGVDCLKDQVILKIKSSFRDQCSNNAINIQEVQQLFNLAKVNEIKKIYPNHQPVSGTDSYGRKLSDLSLIYNITYTSDLDIRKFVAELNALGCVEYAEPRMIVEPMFVPNDDSVSLQWFLYKIRAIDAWDLDTGDYNVVIGVIDGGTNYNHTDLIENAYYTSADPVNGIDDDADGFIDNYRGWDVGDNDNDPQFTPAFGAAHGTAMCGLAAGSTNDGTGIAGVGYRCAYMPIKMVNASYGWIAGYEGLVYGADHGAKILNASWGGTIPGPYEQDVVNYVSVNQNAQIFAAAGNSNNTVPYYPASYEQVICVGATQSNDTKSGNSSYYEQVDLVSPGQALLEPYFNDYGNGNGTSDASAVTSGAAGLISSYYPSSVLPIQIGAIMRQSTYRIDTIPGNASYLNKQGSGRLDIYAAMTNPWEPYLYFNNRTFTDNNDDVLMIGDTVELAGNMLNLLDTSTSSLIAVITDNSPYLEWIDSNVTLGAINTMAFTNINGTPFSFTILPGCPQNQNVLMKVVYFDGSDTLNTQYLSFIINRNYYHVQVNKLYTTVTTTGRIGFADAATRNGLGFRMQGAENNLLGAVYNPMGLFISKGSSWVSDQTLGSPLGSCCPFNTDNNITPVQNIIVNTNSIVADIEVTTGFTDTVSGVNAIGVDVKQKLYGWADSLNDQFLILEYQFHDLAGSGLSDWYTGLFADFDLPDSLLWNLAANKAFYDTVSQSAVAHHIADRYFVGFKMLSPTSNVKYYANNNDGSGGTQNIYNGFTSAEKFNLMNPGVVSNASLTTDISTYLGVHFDSIAPGGCSMMYMALIIGTSLQDFRDQAAAAQAKFDGTFNVWTGNGGNNNWHDAGNWSQGTVPDFNDHVIIPDTRSGSGYSPLISTANGQVKNIEIRCGGVLDVNPPYKLQVGN